MGNNFYSKNEPKLTNFELIKIKKLQFAPNPKTPSTIQTYKFSQDNNYLYLSLQNNVQIQKYDITLTIAMPPTIYDSHTSQINHILIDKKDKYLYGIESQSIRIHYTNRSEEKCELHVYKEEKISSANLFGENFLMVLFEGRFQFDVFDLNTEIKESVRNKRGNLGEGFVGFRSFLFNDVRREFYLMDRNFIYAFDLRNHREMHRKYVFKNKDRKFLHVSRDGKKIFTLKKKKDLCEV